MTAFDAYSREQLRRSYAEAWAKHLAHSPLTPLEAAGDHRCDRGRIPSITRVVGDAGTGRGI